MYSVKILTLYCSSPLHDRIDSLHYNLIRFITKNKNLTDSFLKVTHSSYTVGLLEEYFQ